MKDIQTMAEDTIITLGLMKEKLDLDKFLENCELLENAMVQKNAGQEPYRKATDVNFDKLFRIKAMIIVEACLLAREIRKGKQKWN